ncbi:MAG: hypothetical protein NT105_14760 [Verrucomicrobia bacterium]|nr:hypothetical protein [Verrucomicrobiota bacterium]
MNWFIHPASGHFRSVDGYFRPGYDRFRRNAGLQWLKARLLHHGAGWVRDKVMSLEDESMSLVDEEGWVRDKVMSRRDKLMSVRRTLMSLVDKAG